MTKQDAITMLSERLNHAEDELTGLRKREWEATNGRNAVRIALATLKSKKRVPFLAITASRKFFVVEIVDFEDGNVKYRGFAITKKGNFSKELLYVSSADIVQYESIRRLYEFIEQHMPKVKP